MYIIQAYCSAQAMMNGERVATMSGENIRFINDIIKNWQLAGYYVVEECTTNPGLVVYEPEPLTIVNRKRVFRVFGDYAEATVAADTWEEADSIVCCFDDGTRKGYPWDDARIVETKYQVILPDDDDDPVIAEYYE